MDFERIEQTIREYGIPNDLEDIVNIVRDARGVNVREVVFPAAVNIELRNHTPLIIENEVNRELLIEDYSDYRRANRMSSLANYWMNGYAQLFSFYRSSSPRGTIADNMWPLKQSLETLFNRKSIRDGKGLNDRYRFPVPVVIDQNTRLDLDPELIGSQDHIRIQCFIPPSSNRPSWNRTVSLNLGLTQSVNYGHADTSDAINELRVNGWELITADRAGDEPLIVGACLPESIDPDGRHLIVLHQSRTSRDSVTNSSVISHCVNHIFDRWEQPGSDRPEIDQPSADDLELVATLRSILSVSSGLNNRIESLRSSIQDNRNNADSFAKALTVAIRAINDESAELESLSTGMQDRIVEQIRAMTEVAGQIINIRAVESSNVFADDGNVKLVFTTYKFGMQNASGRKIEIPKLKFELDMMADNYHRGIKIYRADGSTHNYATHPHLGAVGGDGSHAVCWGNAQRGPLPEAWGRRDWMGVCRLICTWITQYNPNSPLTRWTTLAAELPQPPRTGWLVEEIDVEAPETAEGEVVEEAIPF